MDGAAHRRRRHDVYDYDSDSAVAAIDMSMTATRFLSPGGAAASTGEAIKMSAATVLRIGVLQM